MNYIAQNKKAYFNFFISDETEAGISLEGCEVKSIRNGHISINESFIIIDKNNEVWLKNCYIKPYANATNFTPEERRNRRLLLKKHEILKFKKLLETKGYSLIPLKIYMSKTNKIKILIGLGKGKKLYDKRQDLKEKSIKKELQKIKKF